jgi:hypothetical protein
MNIMTKPVSDQDIHDEENAGKGKCAKEFTAVINREQMCAQFEAAWLGHHTMDIELEPITMIQFSWQGFVGNQSRLWVFHFSLEIITNQRVVQITQVPMNEP